MYTLNKAIDCAIREAHVKKLQNKLFKSCDNSEAFKDFSNGDPETLHSITSMYSQFVEDIDLDIAECKILDALINEFPEYE